MITDDTTGQVATEGKRMDSLRDGQLVPLVAALSLEGNRAEGKTTLEILSTTTTTTTTTESTIMIGSNDSGNDNNILFEHNYTQSNNVYGQDGNFKFTSSTTSLEGVKVRNQPAALSTEAKVTPPNTGLLGCLTFEQREKLFQLWGILFAFFAKQPYDSNNSKKRREVALELLRETQESACLSDFTVTDEEGATLECNPLMAELMYQSGTDDPDRTVLRFLRARKWVVVDAFNMLIDTLKWRHTVGVRKLLLEGERSIKTSILEGGKNYFWREDKEGRLVCYIRSRLHDRNAQTLQESIDFTIHTVEVGRRLRRSDEQLVTVVFDLRDAPMASLDVPCMQFMVNSLQSFYPEILGKCLIMDAPWIFSGFWRLVRPLLDPAVAAKIDFIKMEELCRFVDPSAIPLEYAGQSGFVYEYIPPSSADYPLPTPEEDSQSLILCLEVFKTRFVEVTREIHSLITRVEDSVELETLLVPLKEQRDLVKMELCAAYARLDSLVLPRNNYHRIGILEDNGQVVWDNYKGAQFPSPPKLESRASAPPTF